MECNTNVDFLNRERMLTEKDSAPGSEHGMQFLLQQNNKKIAPFNAKESKHSVELCTEGMTGTAPKLPYKESELSVTLKSELSGPRGIGLMQDIPSAKLPSNPVWNADVNHTNTQNYLAGEKMIADFSQNVKDAAGTLGDALKIFSQYLKEADWNKAMDRVLNRDIVHGVLFRLPADGGGETSQYYKSTIKGGYVCASQVPFSEAEKLQNAGAVLFSELLPDAILSIRSTDPQNITISVATESADVDLPFTFPTYSGNATLPIISNPQTQTQTPSEIQNAQTEVTNAENELTVIYNSIQSLVSGQLNLLEELDLSFNEAVQGANTQIRNNGKNYVQHLLASNMINHASAMEEDRNLNMISNSYHYFAWCTVAVLMVAVTVKIAE